MQMRKVIKKMTVHQLIGSLIHQRYLHICIFAHRHINKGYSASAPGSGLFLFAE